MTKGYKIEKEQVSKELTAIYGTTQRIPDYPRHKEALHNRERSQEREREVVVVAVVAVVAVVVVVEREREREVLPASRRTIVMPLARHTERPDSHLPARKRQKCILTAQKRTK